MTTISRIGSIASIGLLSAALTLGATTAALAHDGLISSSPESGAEITTELTYVDLTFSEDFLTISDSTAPFAVQVKGPDSAFYNKGCVELDQATISTMVALGESGTYEVLWQVVSSDGHSTSDSYMFTYVRPADVDASTGSASGITCDPRHRGSHRPGRNTHADESSPRALRKQRRHRRSRTPVGARRCRGHGSRCRRLRPASADQSPAIELVTRNLAIFAGPVTLVLLASTALLASLAFGGGANPGEVLDPGAAVRYGLPVSKLIMNLGVSVTLGALALAVFALGSKDDEFGRAVDVAAAGAGVWTVAAAVTAFFAYSSVSYIPVTLDEAYGQGLGVYLTATEPGRAWLITALLGAAITVTCFAVRNVTALGLVAVVAVLGLVPLSREGHAGGTANHDAAVTAIWLHVIFASFWLGGLLTLLLIRGKLPAKRLAAVLPRYSTIALVCFVVVAASGYVSASIRLEDLPNLLSPYGVLVLVKIAMLGALGLFGAFQRRLLIDRVVNGTTPRWFWLLVIAELAFMGIASGVAAALARTSPPIEAVPISELPDPTPALILTDRELPPELTPTMWFSQWNFDLLWILVCGFALIFYFAGVARLRRRGDTWPWYRTALWTTGILLLFWVTNGPINVYERYLFSVHMLGHMLLSMAAPVLIVLSAPITLGLRAIKSRADGSRGPREWLLLAVHSKVATVLTHPLVAGVLFAASLWLFYYSPLFRWATEDHVGHTWMVLHFLVTGFLFAQTLVGIDPLPNRAPFPLRLILLLATMAMHAFFGLSLVTGTSLLLADWYGAMGRPWGLSPLADQQAGGGVAWSVGEIPTVILAILVVFLWSRSDARDAKRTDRAAERDNDAELRAYNEMLSQRDRR